MSNNKKTEKKLFGGIVAVVVLTICLCVTTLALIWSSVSVEDNLFHTGDVEINLNDGKPIIKEYEFLFEPGMMVKKNFFIQNKSTIDVYYKLYFDNISGGLSNLLQVTIKDGEKIIYQGIANQLDKLSVKAVDDVLAIDERRNLEIYFYYPKESGNNTKDLSLTFDLCADAVQTKNNPNKEFG